MSVGRRNVAEISKKDACCFYIMYHRRPSEADHCYLIDPGGTQTHTVSRRGGQWSKLCTLRKRGRDIESIKAGQDPLAGIFDKALLGRPNLEECGQRVFHCRQCAVLPGVKKSPGELRHVTGYLLLNVQSHRRCTQCARPKGAAVRN